MPDRLMSRSFTVQEPASRLDKFCAEHGLKRSVFSDEGTQILVNGKPAKKSRALEAGDQVEVQWTEQCFEGVVPQDIPLDVLYEDDQILVINKPSGMVVHPAAGNWDRTLVNALLYRYGEDFSTGEDDEDGDVRRPGIVHRLDKDTSGTMIIAKTSKAHAALAAQFKEHTTVKRYLAIAMGRFAAPQGTLHTGIARSASDRKKFAVRPLGEGKEAITDWSVLRQLSSYALLSVVIHTGRTHQIRVHFSSIGHPIAGDPVYGKADGMDGLMLHAFSLTIRHPETGKVMTFRSPLPERFKPLLRLPRP